MKHFNYLKQTLKELVSIDGIPTFEHKIRKLVEKEIQNATNDLDTANIEIKMQTTALGGLWFSIGPKEKTSQHKVVMLDAHMDEVGFIVKHIYDNGFLGITNYGSFDLRVIPSSRYKLVNSKGKYFIGVIGILPPHVTGESKPSVLPMERLYLDLGFSSKEEVIQNDIRIGNPIYLIGDYKDLVNERFTAKAIDDRFGVALELAIIKDLVNDIKNGKTLKNTIVFSFSTQEEGGLRGIASILEYINPDFALVLESTTACDMPNVSKDKYITQLDKGVALSINDKYIYIDQEFLQTVIDDVVLKYNIKYQFKTPGVGGTNAGVIFKHKKGVKTIIASLPARYLHSAVSVASWLDALETYKFAYHFVEWASYL